MKKKKKVRILSVVINTIALFIFAYLVQKPPLKQINDTNFPRTTPQVIGKKTSAGENTFVVSEVIDGDTVRLSDGQVVRYIGVDTPEIKEGDCYAEKAKYQNTVLVGGQEVRLEKDVSETDRYGRLLRYVFLQTDKGEIFINDYLVKNGYALIATYPPDVKYKELFLASQKKAKENFLGLWGQCK